MEKEDFKLKGKLNLMANNDEEGLKLMETINNLINGKEEH